MAKKAIFIYEPQDLIDTYFMPSKSSLYYCCLRDLFILLRNIPSVEAAGEMHGMQFTLNLHDIGFLYWLIKHAKRTFPQH